ncbi:hypothetical protein ACP6H7_00415 [Vibrio harveyi]|uniref:hypothetical protein n=1 Tax=Vibrio harveyi TaxID=669 RepID=UPI00330BA2D8|nr:hypothetical protein [Vibrio harveyi]
MFDRIINYIEAGDYLFVFMAIAFSLLVNLKHILESISEHKKKRFKILEQSISLPIQDKRLRSHLNAELDTEIFYLAHNVRVSSVLLDSLLKLKDEIGDRISFLHIVRCSKLAPDLTNIKDKNFQIQLSLFDRVYGLYNFSFGFIGFTIGIFWFAYSLYLLSISPNFNSLLVSLLTTVIGFTLMYQATPMISTILINKKLKTR